MASRWHDRVIAVLAILVVFLLVTAGCTTIPGPEPRPTPAATKTTVPVTPQVKVTVTQVPPTSPAVVATRTILQITPTLSPRGTSESRTCAQQGGGIAQPGQQCPGTWLVSTDSFSCCSVTPVRAPVVQNASVVIDPFDIATILDDDPGSILP
jgi:hypothetical protein